MCSRSLSSFSFHRMTAVIYCCLLVHILLLLLLLWHLQDLFFHIRSPFLTLSRRQYECLAPYRVSIRHILFGFIANIITFGKRQNSPIPIKNRQNVKQIRFVDTHTHTDITILDAEKLFFLLILFLSRRRRRRILPLPFFSLASKLSK